MDGLIIQIKNFFISNGNSNQVDGYACHERMEIPRSRVANVMIITSILLYGLSIMVCHKMTF